MFDPILIYQRQKSKLLQYNTNAQLLKKGLWIFFSYLQTLEIPIVCDVNDELECSPECEFPPKPSLTDPDNKKVQFSWICL